MSNRAQPTASTGFVVSCCVPKPIQFTPDQTTHGWWTNLQRIMWTLGLLLWQAPLGVCSAKRRHQSPEWTILSHIQLLHSERGCWTSSCSWDYLCMLQDCIQRAVFGSVRELARRIGAAATGKTSRGRKCHVECWLVIKPRPTAVTQPESTGRRRLWRGERPSCAEARQKQRGAGARNSQRVRAVAAFVVRASLTSKLSDRLPRHFTQDSTFFFHTRTNANKRQYC